MIVIALCLFSLFFMWLASKQFPGICRVKLASVWKFFLVMMAITAFRFIVHKTVGLPIRPENDASPMYTIQIIYLFSVFWEDAVFTLPILVADKLKAPNLLKMGMFALSSIAFASGHIDYGLPWAFLTLFYVPFISYKYGKENGLGTVMVCHVLYDLITILSFRYLLS